MALHTVGMSLALDSGKKPALFPVIDVSQLGNIAVHRRTTSNSPFENDSYNMEWCENYMKPV